MQKALDLAIQLIATRTEIKHATGATVVVQASLIVDVAILHLLSKVKGTANDRIVSAQLSNINGTNAAEVGMRYGIIFDGHRARIVCWALGTADCGQRTTLPDTSPNWYDLTYST